MTSETFQDSIFALKVKEDGPSNIKFISVAYTYDILGAHVLVEYSCMMEHVVHVNYFLHSAIISPCLFDS
jgi:hypothetical protein